MKCPYCASTKNKVVDKRQSMDENANRRRRECLACKKRYTTYERIEQVEIFVIKKDNSRVHFDKTKLMSGISRACEKRPVSFEQMQQMAANVEATVLKMDKKEVTSRQIGELVMKQLKKADKVAYIRFASVYKDFKDVDEFADELQKLVKK